MKYLILAVIMALTVSISAKASIEVYDFDNAQQEQQFKDLGNILRCPKCQNNTIADSNAALAQDLRQKVYDMTKEGKSEDEIVDYMIARYGNFVTYDPPLTLATSILWLGPLFVILFGFGLIIIRSKRSVSSIKANEHWDEEKEKRLNALLSESLPPQHHGDESK